MTDTPNPTYATFQDEDYVYHWNLRTHVVWVSLPNEPAFTRFDIDDYIPAYFPENVPILPAAAENWKQSTSTTL